MNKRIWPGCDLIYGMKQWRKSLCWPGMEANFHYKHSLNENNHLEFFFIMRKIAQDKVSHVISSSAHSLAQGIQRAGKNQSETHETSFLPIFICNAVDRFRLPCGQGSRKAFRCDAFAKPLIGISLASRVGRAIDGRKSLRKSASLINFGGVVFVPTSKFLLFIPYCIRQCKNCDVGRGVQANFGFSDLAHGLLGRRTTGTPSLFALEIPVLVLHFV